MWDLRVRVGGDCTETFRRAGVMDDDRLEREADAAIKDGKRMQVRLYEAGRGAEALILFFRTRTVECLLETYRAARRELRRGAVLLRRRARRVRKTLHNWRDDP